MARPDEVTTIVSDLKSECFGRSVLATFSIHMPERSGCAASDCACAGTANKKAKPAIASMRDSGSMAIACRKHAFLLGRRSRELEFDRQARASTYLRRV